MSATNDPSATSTSAPSSASTAPRLRAQLRLLVAALIAASGCCVALALSSSNVAAELTRRDQQAQRLVFEVRRIAALAHRPQIAMETSLPVADLQERIAQAMKSAGLEPACLVSTLPQPPKRVPGAARVEVACRLLFEKVRLEPLVRCGWSLLAANPQLHITGLQLHNSVEAGVWNADLTITYYLLAASEPSGGRL